MAVAFALIAMLAVASASPLATEGGSIRRLRFTCADVQSLQGNCDALCECINENNPSYAGNCRGACESCISAAQSCIDDESASLPDACADYQAAAAPCIGGRR